MKIYEIGTGYTPIPAQISAATEIVVEELTKEFVQLGVPAEIIDIAVKNRAETDLPIREVPVPGVFSGTDVQLGVLHKLKRVVYSVALAQKLKKLLKEAEEKVVLHFHNQYNLFFFLKLVPRLLRDRCVIAYTNHSGVWRLEWNEAEDMIRKRYFQEAECMKNADLVFLLNPETKQNVMTHLKVPEERIVLIGNGVNTNVYRPLTKDLKNTAKEKWGLTGKTVVLQVGSVYENKGQLRSLEYLLPMLKSSENTVYVYAGGIVDEAYQEQIQAFVKKNGVEDKVCYLGMLSPGEELNGLYNAADLTILPSRYEAFGLVAIESFAAGVPVLIDEESPIDFGAGAVSYDRGSFAGAMGILEDRPRYENMCAAARNTAVTHYGWNKIAGDYLAAFLDKVKENGEKT